jgi:hypothetical protein
MSIMTPLLPVVLWTQYGLFMKPSVIHDEPRVCLLLNKHKSARNYVKLMCLVSGWICETNQKINKCQIKRLQFEIHLEMTLLVKNLKFGVCYATIRTYPYRPDT